MVQLSGTSDERFRLELDSAVIDRHVMKHIYKAVSRIFPDREWDHMDIEDIDYDTTDNIYIISVECI